MGTSEQVLLPATRFSAVVTFSRICEIRYCMFELLASIRQTRILNYCSSSHFYSPRPSLIAVYRFQLSHALRSHCAARTPISVCTNRSIRTSSRCARRTLNAFTKFATRGQARCWPTPQHRSCRAVSIRVCGLRCISVGRFQPRAT